MRGEKKEAKVLAILLADIHLSLKAPLWRSAEPDWLEAQKLVLLEICALQGEYECLVICAGDIFDRSRKIADGWNASPELINFAIQYLPDDMYAIPGQHDLPNHQYDDIRRSAYWTLVRAGKIKNIVPNDITIVANNLDLSGFPPGYEIKPLIGVSGKDCVSIAVVHKYRCIPYQDYPGAPKEAYFRMGEKNLMGYDVIVYGDNHKGFMTDINVYSKVFNCGTLMRRKSDEIDYKPQVGLLMDDGSVVPHFLDTSQDKYITKAEEQVKATLDMGDFFDELEKLGKTALDFKEAMKQFLSTGKTSNEAKEIILRAMEE